MRRTVPMALALIAGMMMSAPARVAASAISHDSARLLPGAFSVETAALAGLVYNQATPTPFQEGQRVRLVGRITSAPKTVAGVREEQKMQVAIGPGKVDFTLHLGDAVLVDANGRTLETDDLVDGQWVRAEGSVMDDPRRIQVIRLRVIDESRPNLRHSRFRRAGFDHGYIIAVDGSGKVFPAATGLAPTRVPIVIVGKVSDDTGSLENTRKLQVEAAGNTWTLHVPEDARVLDTKGETISVHEVSEGQWVRVHGWQTDDLRVRVRRIESIGRDEAARASR